VAFVLFDRFVFIKLKQLYVRVPSSDANELLRAASMDRSIRPHEEKSSVIWRFDPVIYHLIVFNITI
jgi:hypothetical protein